MRQHDNADEQGLALNYYFRCLTRVIRVSLPRGQVRLFLLLQNMPLCGFLNFSSQPLLPPAYADSSSSVNPHLFSDMQQGERPSRKENKVCSFLPLSISQFTVSAALQLSHKVAISFKIQPPAHGRPNYSKISLTGSHYSNSSPRSPYGCPRVKTTHPRSVQTPVFYDNGNERDCYSFNPKSTPVSSTTYGKAIACPHP